MDTSKIIKGVVNSGRYTVTAPIIKEDYGLYLQIEGVELPQTYEVDFSNSEHNGTSVTMIGNSDGVLIPHQFIDTGKDVFAFLYHVGEDFGRTVYKFRIPNKCRPDRTDDTPTPEEQSTIDQAISALNTAVAQTAEDRENADASAQSAYESADEAQQARDNAQTYANNAQTSANNASASASQASASATSAAQSASQSAQIKDDVEGMVDDAQGYAQASAQSASQASASEQGCARAVLDAASAAAIARARAEEASGYAQTASAKAQDASTSAQTASTKASEASGYATTASNKATEASGYATASQTAQGLAESARDSAISAKNDAESARDEAQNIVDGISAKAEQIDANTASVASLEEDRYKPYAVDTASGAVASFVDGADDIPLKSLIVNIDPVQDLHGYDSPWVGGGGKNLFDQENVTVTGNAVVVLAKAIPAGTYTISALVTSTDTDATYNRIVLWDENNAQLAAVALTRDTRASASFTIASACVKVVFYASSTAGNSSGDTATFTKVQIEEGSTATDWSPYENICPISGWTGCNVWHGGKNLLDPTVLKDQSSWNIITLHLTPNTLYVMSTNSNVSTLPIYFLMDGESQGSGTKVTASHPVVRLTKNDGILKIIQRRSSASESFSNYHYQIEIGSTATEYEPYNGTTLPINWQSEAGTVYGGSLDVLSGVLTVDRAMIASYNGETLPSTWISDRDAYAQGATPTTGAQVVYKLATPTTVQLTPHEVATLLGVNNIFADTGDTEVEYRADTKLYIEKLTQPEEDDMIADSNIVSGQYFMVGNSLYKATANIASGGQVIVGTNCIRKSLSEALNEINA